MNYKAILFDMDGVIIDSEPLHAAAFKATLLHHGKDLTDAQYKEYFAGKTDKDGFERYFESINETVDLALIMNEKTQKYLQISAKQLEAYPGVISLIKELSVTHQLALVTSSSSAEVDVALQTLGITNAFEVVISADDIKNGKPDPEGYVKALEQLAVAKEECVIVEDSPSGVKAGKAAGVDVIAVTNTHMGDKLLQADRVVDRLTARMF